MHWLALLETNPGRACGAGISARSLEPAAQVRRWLRITSLKTLAESASLAERDSWATRWRRVRRHCGNTREPESDEAKNLSCDRAGGRRGHAHALGFAKTVASDRRVSNARLCAEGSA